MMNNIIIYTMDTENPDSFLTNVLCSFLKEAEEWLNQMAEANPIWALIKLEISMGLASIITGYNLQNPCECARESKNAIPDLKKIWNS